MKKFTSLFFFFILFFSLQLQAQVIQLDQGKQNDFSFTSNTYDELIFSNTIANLNHQLVKTPDANYTLIALPGYGQSNIIGDPQLPMIKKIIEIPIGGSIEIKIIHEKFMVFDLVDFGVTEKLIPAQAPVSKSIENPQDIRFEINEDTYARDEFIALPMVEVKPLGTMRGVKLARLEIAPIQYNPVQNKLRVCTGLTVEVTFRDADISQTTQQKMELFSPYFERMYASVSNYKPLAERELIMDEPATYIIVSDPMFESQLQEFIQWKTMKGFRVVEAYTNNPFVGTTTTSISNYLEGFFNNPPAGYLPQSFVLFVGDVAQIPAFNGTAGSHVTDLYYCEYTNDLFPECYYGRFSAENAGELQPQIDKTLEYERYLMPDPSFLGEAVMVAGNDAGHELTWGNGQINYGTSYYFNMAHGIFSHIYLQDEPPGGNYSELIRGNVSDGVAYANYTAHCSSAGWADPSFTISHIAALQNDHKYPLMVGNCCLSVEFDVNDCFGEEILMAANKGALGYVGGSNSTYWDEDFWWGVGYESISANPVYHTGNLGSYDRTFHDQGEPLAEWYHTQGQMPSAGNLAVSQAGSSLETYYWEIYHLMGDPSLMVYFGVPDVTTASYDPLMPLGSTTFTVNTYPYAYVAITKEGVLHGAAVADITGVAEVIMDPINVPGEADIVVTRQNGQPFFGTVTVASPEGPYLALEDWSVNDISGNGNGLADYGELLFLDMTLENLGSDPATNVSATLSTSDPYLSIFDNSQNWPDIPAGTTSLQLAAYGLNIAGDVPDQHMAELELSMTDGNETWISTFTLTMNAPQLEPATNLMVDDGAGGNGRLDPGETADITLLVFNNGHSDSPGFDALLSSASSFIAINNGLDIIDPIPYGSSALLTFNISCSPSTPVGTSVDFTVNADAGVYGFEETWYLAVGLNVEDWETGDFTRYPWDFSGTADWFITTIDPYEGTYCSQSGDISDNQNSSLIVTLQTSADDDISFYRKVSSESGYDYLEFYVDGVMLDRWAGEVAWGQVSYFIEAGIHTFSWVYDKDYSVSSGSDCAWIDYVVFPPLAPMEPDIEISPAYIDFGDVVVGEESSTQFTIINNGALTLSGNMTTPMDFSIALASKKIEKYYGKNTMNFSILPGESETFELTFAPTLYQCYSDFLLINSNDPDEPQFSYPISGCGVEGPSIVIDPVFFDEVLAPGQTSSEVLYITNNGGLTLDYTANVVYADKYKDVVLQENFNTGIPASWTIIDGGETTHSWYGETSYSGSTLDGTPFAFVDSDDAGYVDMDETLLTPAMNTYGFTDLTLEFDQYYRYYSSGGSEKADVDIWDGSAWINILSMTSTNMGNWGSPDHQVIDILEYANPEMKIRFHYYDANYDWFWALDNVEISGTPGPTGSWLTLNGGNTTSGAVASMSTDEINVGFDASELEEGIYYADIYLSSNDLQHPMEVVPVTLTVTAGYEVDLTILLGGAYRDGEMSAALNTLADFPFNQPYNVAPWNYFGEENISEIPNTDIVDWILVELRDASAPGEADEMTVINRQAAFVLKNGQVVSTDGSSLLFFDTPVSEGLFIAVYHRNHLAVLSDDALPMESGIYVYDFSLAMDAVYGGVDGYLEIAPGIFGMAGGDADCNGIIDLADIVDNWEQHAGLNGYLNMDFNLDGQNNNQDKDDCWLPARDKTCQLP